MQRLIKNGEVVNDSWHLLDKDATLDGLPNSDSIIVPLALWLEHSHALKARQHCFPRIAKCPRASAPGARNWLQSRRSACVTCLITYA